MKYFSTRAVCERERACFNVFVSNSFWQAETAHGRDSLLRHAYSYVLLKLVILLAWLSLTNTFVS